MNNIIESIKEVNGRKHKDTASVITVSECWYFNELGINMIWNDGKDVILEREDLSAATE